MSCFVLMEDHVEFHKLNYSKYQAEVLVSTTWNCNLRCSYCFVNKCNLSTKNSIMTPELAKQLVDTLDEGLTHVKTICIHLYGGEPLTNLPALEAIVSQIRTKKDGRFRLAITTNGTISSPDVFELLQLGNFQVILSIDGPSEIHDECRVTLKGLPTHDTVINFLSELRSRTNCWIRGSAVVRSGWNLEQAASYLYKLPLDAIKAQAVRLPTNTLYSLNTIEKALYLQDLDKVGDKVIEDIEAGRKPHDDRFSSRILQLLMGISRKSFCGAGCTNFGIIPDGTILPCVLLNQSDNNLGHIYDNPHTWIRKGAEWKEIHKARKECYFCSAFSLCGGGCPALLPVCGDDECDIIRKNCEIATRIYYHFKSKPYKLLVLARSL